MAGELRHQSGDRAAAGAATQAEFDKISAHAFDNQAKGDIPHAPAITGGLTRVAIGAAGSFFVPQAGIPAWLLGQLPFPAAQNASADPNTLDDYEEGTWTPDLQFGGLKVGITYSTQAGHYTKIGRMVFLMGQIALTSKGSSVGDAVIQGLPFTVGNTEVPTSLRVGQMSFNAYPFGIVSVTKIELYESTVGGVLTTITDVDFADNSNLSFTAVYRI